MNPCILWGGTGHAKVLRECLPGTQFVAVFDRDPDIAPPFSDVPLLAASDFDTWRSANPGPHDFLVAIGGARGADRLERHAALVEAGLQPLTAVHRTAHVAGSLGAGTHVLAGAIVGVEAVLGSECIVNTGATVDHECVLGDGVHVAPGAHLAGLVRVGNMAFIGTGATVIPRVNIGAGAIVGAGAVVLDDVPDGATVVGNPARPLRR